MNKNIKDMLGGVLDSDAEKFVDAFSKEMSDRVADKIASKHVDVTTNVLKPEPQEEN
mgnify:CR=1 FL=1